MCTQQSYLDSKVYLSDFHDNTPAYLLPPIKWARIVLILFILSYYYNSVWQIYTIAG